MSVAMDSDTDLSVVYVRLFDEGTEVLRPAPAERIREGVFRLLTPVDFDPADELWEYPPGSVVVCRVERRGDEEIMVAHSLAIASA
jgi:hypothetical protein